MDLNQEIQRAANFANQGKFNQAEQVLREIIAADGRFHPAVHMLGQLAFQRGRDDIAAQLFHRATILGRNVAQYHRDHAEALFYLGRIEEALSAINRSLRINPNDPKAHFVAGNSLMNIGERDQAIKAFEKTIALEPNHGYAHNNLGSLYETDGRLKEAKREYQIAIKLDKSNTLALGNLAALLTVLGDIERGKELLNEVIKVRPDYIEAHHNLSALKQYQEDDEHIDILKSLLNNIENIPVENRIRLYFVLGKVYADLKDYDIAFEYYHSGNKLKRSTYEYDENHVQKIVENIKTIFSKTYVGGKEISRDDKLVPIFIVGMPRSGSSLVEQILSSHSKVHGGGELPFLGDLLNERLGKFPDDIQGISDDELEDIGLEYLKKVRMLNSEAQYIVDKMPSNYQYVGLITKILPEALIINTNRDPMDCCVSIYTKLFLYTLPYTNDLGELGRYFKVYCKLMDHWRAVIPDGVLYDISYENVVENFEVEVRKLIDFIGLDWEDECLSFYENKSRVKTASAAQVRKPIYKTSIERWRVYEKHLAPLYETLNHNITD